MYIMLCSICIVLEDKTADNKIISNSGSKSLEGVESHSDGDHISPESRKHRDSSKHSNAIKSLNTCT